MSDEHGEDVPNVSDEQRKVDAYVAAMRVGPPLVDEGETLRDRFAMAALAGGMSMAFAEREAIRAAYLLADAMLEARKK